MNRWRHFLKTPRWDDLSTKFRRIHKGGWWHLVIDLSQNHSWYTIENCHSQGSRLVCKPGRCAVLVATITTHIQDTTQLTVLLRPCNTTNTNHHTNANGKSGHVKCKLKTNTTSIQLSIVLPELIGVWTHDSPRISASRKFRKALLTWSSLKSGSGFWMFSVDASNAKPGLYFKNQFSLAVDSIDFSKSSDFGWRGAQLSK